MLDLFAGTGSISYEFASRGTTSITSVDENLGCINFINQTAEGFEMPITTIKSDAFKFLDNSRSKFDVIFADPPYAFTLEQFSKIPDLVFQNELLDNGAVLVLEHAKQMDLSSLPHFSYAKNYGSSVFSFFENAE